MTYELWRGDCRACLANMADDSVDAIVSDPPYELGFMGKGWDASGIAYDADLWRECLRVLKPGGHLLAFGGSRTYHRLAVAIEDAGFQIRDGLIWLYGSGFPKSLDVSKAIDKAAGAERVDLGPKFSADGRSRGIEPSGGGRLGNNLHDGGISDQRANRLSAPATPEAQQWEGWGTALKPAHEPIIMARRPFPGTVAANVLAHGTGALNIDACRIEASGRPNLERRHDAELDASRITFGTGLNGSRAVGSTDLGRFPANVAHDGSEPVVAIFPAQAGAAAPVHRRTGDKFLNSYGAFAGNIDEAGSTFQGDSGSAARFFYCAKASKADRDEGCADIMTAYDHSGPRGHSFNGDGSPRPASRPRGNTHPTVKPTALMRWLVRLVTPPGGLVFDPFTGSGSTGKAALLEGFRFLGAELTPEYWPIATARLDHAVNQRHTAQL